MNNIKMMDEIIEKIKNIISTDVEKLEGRDRKIKDKDVAFFLGISPIKLATAKHRGTVLFEELALFCKNREIAFNSLVFEQRVESLQENTNKYLFYSFM